MVRAPLHRLSQCLRKELKRKPGLPAQSRVQPPNKISILNSERPSNPFTTSNEPDWVIIPKLSTQQGLLSQETDSGAAKNGETRSFCRQKDARRTPSSNARKSSSGELTSDQEERGIISSLASSMSSSSRALRGKAPPIPQKPAVLAGPHEQSTKPSAILRQDFTTPTSSKFHGTRETSLLLSSAGPLTKSHKSLQSYEPLPGRSPQKKRSKNQPDMPQYNGPPLPPRGLTVQACRSRGFLDEDDNSASAIPSLQPARRS